MLIGRIDMDETNITFFCKICFNEPQQQLIETLIGWIDTDETDITFLNL
jgi:hypothetical protein